MCIDVSVFSTIVQILARARVWHFEREVYALYTFCV